MRPILHVFKLYQVLLDIVSKCISVGVLYFHNVVYLNKKRKFREKRIIKINTCIMTYYVSPKLKIIDCSSLMLVFWQGAFLLLVGMTKNCHPISAIPD